MFRLSLRQVATVSRHTSRLQYFPNFSTVAENTIRITFVDQDGNRATLPALIGQSLLEVARKYKIDIEGPCDGGGGPLQERRTDKWVEYTYGEGPNCFYCHVQIPSNFNHLFEPITVEEKTGLQDIWEDEFHHTSRLACMIRLEKKHDNLVVFVPDSPPTDCV